LQKIKIFINGFGRIGQHIYQILKDDDSYKIVGVNDIYDIDLDGIKTFKEKDPKNLNMKDVDILIQSSGKFLTKQSNEIYIKNGAKKVIISAPSDAKAFLYGINHKEYCGEEIISSSSCSATAIGPIVKAFEKFDIKGCYCSMIHSYTNDQQLLDDAKIYKDIRRVRSATINILPLYSTAPKALKKFFPKLEIEATSIRVPIAHSTYYDITLNIESKIDNFEDIIKNNFEYTYEKKVSSDFILSPYPITIDMNFSSSHDKIVKISGWQDNEYGYAYQLIKLIKVISE